MARTNGQRGSAADDRRRPLEELDGIVAVLPMSGQWSSEGMIGRLGRLVDLRAEAGGSWATVGSEQSDGDGGSWASVGPEHDGIDGFVDAGWVFVEPTEAVRCALRGRNRIEGVVALARVFRDGSGRVLVGTWSVLDDDLLDELVGDDVVDVREDGDPFDLLGVGADHGFGRHPSQAFALAGVRVERSGMTWNGVAR